MAAVKRYFDRFQNILKDGQSSFNVTELSSGVTLVWLRPHVACSRLQRLAAWRQHAASDIWGKFTKHSTLWSIVEVLLFVDGVAKEKHLCCQLNYVSFWAERTFKLLKQSIYHFLISSFSSEDLCTFLCFKYIVYWVSLGCCLDKSQHPFGLWGILIVEKCMCLTIFWHCIDQTISSQ